MPSFFYGKSVAIAHVVGSPKLLRGFGEEEKPAQEALATCHQLWSNPKNWCLDTYLTHVPGFIFNGLGKGAHAGMTKRDVYDWATTKVTADTFVLKT